MTFTEERKKRRGWNISLIIFISALWHWAAWTPSPACMGVVSWGGTAALGPCLSPRHGLGTQHLRAALPGRSQREATGSVYIITIIITTIININININTVTHGIVPYSMVYCGNIIRTFSTFQGISRPIPLRSREEQHEELVPGRAGTAVLMGLS